MTGQTKQGGKNKKYGRNKPGAVIYKAENRYERNKTRRLRRHIKAHLFDKSAIKALRDTNWVETQQLMAGVL